MVVAADWLRRSAEQGDPDAQYFLGNLYYNGEGVPRQQQESIRLWRQAAAQGHVESELSGNRGIPRGRRRSGRRRRSRKVDAQSRAAWAS